MAQVELKDLAKEAGLDPKLARRIIRKSFPQTRSGGQYQFDNETQLYQEIIKACKTYSGQKEKKASRPKKERSFQKIEWEGIVCPVCRGKASEKSPCKRCGTEGEIIHFNIVDGQVWGLALVPQPDDSNVREVKPVYLGLHEEVRLILEGKKGIPPLCDHLARSVFETILKGKGLL